MDFKINTAYICDSLSKDNRNTLFYNVLSFTGNDVILDSRISELLSKLNLESVSLDEIQNWLSNDDNYTNLLNLLHIMSRQKDQIGIISSFVEIEYGIFLFIAGMMFSTTNPSEVIPLEYLEQLYCSYSNMVNHQIQLTTLAQRFDNIDKIVSQQIRTNNKYKKYESFYLENRSKVINLISIVERNHLEEPELFLLSEFIFYSRQYISIYKTNNIKKINGLKNTIDNLLFAFKLKNETCTSEMIIIDEKMKEDSVPVFSNFVLSVLDYILNKLGFINDANELPENDKYLFLAIWLLFQGENCDWILSPMCFEKINTLFNSIEKEITI